MIENKYAISFKISKNSNIVSYSINYVSDFNACSWRLEPYPLTPIPHKHLYLWSDHRTKGIQWSRYTISNIYMEKTQHACHVQ